MTEREAQRICDLILSPDVEMRILGNTMFCGLCTSGDDFQMIEDLLRKRKLAWHVVHERLSILGIKYRKHKFK